MPFRVIRDEPDGVVPARRSVLLGTLLWVVPPGATSFLVGDIAASATRSPREAAQ